MQKKYIVRLTDEERETLNLLVKKRRVSSQKVRRAHVLLKADADGPNWTDAAIAEAFDCRTRFQTMDKILWSAPHWRDSRRRFQSKRRLTGPLNGNAVA